MAQNIHTRQVLVAVKKYREAVDAWETFSQNNQHKIKLWSVIRREIHAAVQRKEEFLEEEAQRGWMTWDNISQNTHWLLNGSPPQMTDLADALGVPESVYTDNDGKPWYQAFLIDSEQRANLTSSKYSLSYQNQLWEMDERWGGPSDVFKTSAEVIRNAQLWASNQKNPNTNDRGANFLEFGQTVAYLRGYMEYNAQWLRQVLWFRGKEPDSDEPQRLEQELDDGNLANEWLQDFQRLGFTTQVDVIDSITQSLPKTETGKQILLEMMDEDFPFSFNVLALFDREKMASQRQFTYTVDGESKTEGLIAEPSTQVEKNTYTKVPPEDRYVLSGNRDGKTDAILRIGNRLWHALSRQMGDRSRAKKLVEKPNTMKVGDPKDAYYAGDGDGGIETKPASDHLVESWETLSRMFGSILYGTYSDEDLGQFLDVSGSDANDNINKLRTGKISGRNRFTIGNSAVGQTGSAPVDELASFVNLLSHIHTGVTSVTSAASPVFKLGTNTVGKFIGATSGFLTAYKMIYHEDAANYQNSIQDALTTVNTLMGVRDDFSDIFKLFYKVGSTGDLKTLERVIMESDMGGVDLGELGDDRRYVKSMYNKYYRPSGNQIQNLGKSIDDEVDTLVTGGNNYGRRIQKGLTNAATVIEAAKSAFDSHQLFQTGDYDAAVATGVLGVASVVGVFAGGWVGVTIELLVIIGSIFVAHFTDPPLVEWLKQTIFGNMWRQHDYDAEPRETRPQWFKYDDQEEGTARQLSSYKNVKMGFQLSGSGDQMAWYARLLADSGAVAEYDRSIGDPTLTVEFGDVPEVDEYSKFILRPVVRGGDGFDVEPPIYIFSMPPMGQFESSTGHETQFVEKDGSLGEIKTTGNGYSYLDRNDWFFWSGNGPATKVKLASNEHAFDFEASGSGIHKLELVMKSPSGHFFSEPDGKKPWGVEVIHVPEDNFTGTFEYAIADAAGSDALMVEALMLYKKPFPRMIVDINR